MTIKRHAPLPPRFVLLAAAWLSLAWPLLPGTARAGSEPAEQQHGVRVATWNLFDLPEGVFGVASHARMAHIAANLHEIFPPHQPLDAIVLTEAYVRQDRKLLLQALGTLGLTHFARLISRDPRDIASMGGLMVVSRWPIDGQDSIVFRHACQGFDCLTTKGALHVTLHKQEGGTDVPIHLVGVHLHVGEVGQRVQARRRQARALRAFVRKQKLTENDTVILAGDFNADYKEDGNDLLALLGAHPTHLGGALDHTFGGEGHFLAGSPRLSIAQRCARAAHGVPAAQQEGRKWIDYVFAAQPGRKPERQSMTVVVPHLVPYVFGSPSGAHCASTALSDHNPVVGRMAF